MICTRTVHQAFETNKIERQSEIKKASDQYELDKHAAKKHAKTSGQAVVPVSAVDKTDPKGEQITMDRIKTEFNRCGVSGFAWHPVQGANTTGHATTRWGHTPMMGPAKTIIMAKINIRKILPNMPFYYTEWLQVPPPLPPVDCTLYDHYISLSSVGGMVWLL